jgi:hypothetical protein
MAAVETRARSRADISEPPAEDEPSGGRFRLKNAAIPHRLDA